MAYAGYLIKLGGSSGTVLPLTYMKPDSYVTEPNQRLESEAGRAVSGMLHRTTLAQTKTKIEFETPNITNDQVAVLNGLIFGAMSDQHRKDITIEYYDMETDTYKVANCYVPDIKYTIHTIKDLKIIYNPIRYAFIEY